MKPFYLLKNKEKLLMNVKVTIILDIGIINVINEQM